MANNVKKIITLRNGGNRLMTHDTEECPMCLNGHMIVKEIIDDEWMIMECQTCGTQLHVPFVNITEEPLGQ